MSSERISATRRIAVPASTIFQIVTSPGGHAATQLPPTQDLPPPQELPQEPVSAPPAL